MGPIIRTGKRGFSLLELAIVMAIIAILVSISVPMYQGILLRTRETVLRDNLRTLRNLIDQYTADKKKAPQALQDLVEAGYLREIPEDSITNSTETWEVVTDTSVSSPDQIESGIVDVHSGSTAIASDGTPYNTW
jgi:general secretion pathway protein G